MNKEDLDSYQVLKRSCMEKGEFYFNETMPENMIIYKGMEKLEDVRTSGAVIAACFIDEEARKELELSGARVS